ncbi:helix-turn-helix domain-containing protein [Enterococcus casseliflavus]|uniref:helix-turn-helix domain-containing protein n=1 Tax=Enterococcus TaxID=1350 RepID=UPI001CD30DF7|nr:helix-turn-helix domain-containing protein [Enterococcus casseliflavus]
MKLEVDLSPTIEQQLTKVASRVWAETMQREVEKRTFPEWMDLKTTCKYLQISRSNLSKFIKELDFPVSTISQTKRCNRKKVDEWMAQFEI